MLIRTVVAVTSLFLLLICPITLAQAPITQADVMRVRAEIELLKQNIEIKEAEAQAPITKADLMHVRAEIELLRQNIEIKEAELRTMESQMSRQPANPAPRQTTAPKPTPPPKPTPAPKPTPKPAKETKAPEAPLVVTPTPAPPTPTTPAVSTAAPKRANIDPTPYEASIVGRVPRFRANQSSKWLALDEKRLVYWVLDDEAYLLNLSQTCEGLLSAEKLKLESFSNKIRAGHDGVVLNNQQRCPIESISLLGGRSLPKPPRK